jgi:hypothetical protein
MFALVITNSLTGLVSKYQPLPHIDVHWDPDLRTFNPEPLLTFRQQNQLTISILFAWAQGNRWHSVYEFLDSKHLSMSGGGVAGMGRRRSFAWSYVCKYGPHTLNY